MAALKETKEKWIPLIVLPFLLLVCFALWAASESAPSVPIQSEGDVWDLREFDFSNATAIAKLRGPVAYIPNALLTPEEFETRIHEIVYGYPEEDNIQYATSRMRILVPDGWYAFSCLSVDFSERLYINGNLMFEIGSPSDSRETTVPDTRTQIMTLTPVDGVIEIVMQSSNFVHRESGGHAGWKVGNPEALSNALRGGYLTNIVMGCYLALFLVHMILFLLLRTYRVNLLFALSCLMWFLRSGVTWTKVFSFLFPSMSWFTKFRIEYLSFPVTAVLFIALVHALFPGVLQKWFRYAMAAAMSVFAALFLIADTLFMSWAILWCEGVFAAAMIYIIARFAMKLRRVSPEQLIFLMGAALFLYAAANDMLDHNNVTSLLFFPFINRDLSQISMLIFAFFEAVAIFIATAREIGEAKAEEQRLAFENAALKETARMTEQLTSLQRRQYEGVAETAKTVNAQRHDLRHQLAVLKGYNSSGDAERLGAYLDELTANIPAPDEKRLCENFAVNAVALHYLTIAERDGIKTSVSLSVPVKTGRVQEIDLCVIVGNLLENAIEACKRQICGERFIELNSSVQSDMLTITLDNSFDGNSAEKNGVFLSSKRGGRGVGLSSVQAVARKYGGDATFEAKGTVFQSFIYVDMKKPETVWKSGGTPAASR